MLSQKVRAYIYTVLTALAPILVFYGVITEDSVGMWIAFAGAVLAMGGTGLAAANTPKNE